jgi:hypothetical protein
LVERGLPAQIDVSVGALTRFRGRVVEAATGRGVRATVLGVERGVQRWLGAGIADAGDALEFVRAAETLTGPAPAILYDLAVEAPGWTVRRPADLRRTYAVGQASDSWEIAVVPARRVAGIIVDAAGEPVPGVLIEHRVDGGPTEDHPGLLRDFTRSDVSGRFVVASAPLEAFSLVVRRRDGGSAEERVSAGDPGSRLGGIRIRAGDD